MNDTPEQQRRDDAAACAEAIGQILAALDGNFAWLTPVYDPTGRLVDFEIAAICESARDVADRRGSQLLGTHMLSEYPETVHGQLWDAFVEVFTHGGPRTVGPFGYRGPITTVPATLQITMSLQRVGDGVFNTWKFSSEKGQLEERIAQTERLGNLGWSEQDLLTGATVWSEQLYHIYGRDPADGPLSEAESEAITVAEDVPIRRQIAERMALAQSADATYRIRTPHGIRHIRVVAETERDQEGRPLRAYGIVQDVTTQEASRHKIAEVEQQLQERQQDLAAEHRLASALQEIILPIPLVPFDLPSLRVAVRYLPAEQASRIGGDWYEASTGHDGSVVLAIGDMAGHGLRAAASMAQLRHAFVALSSTTTTEPAALLTHLNRLLFAGGEPQTIASAIAARYDPRHHTLQWAQAGHPAPLRSRHGVTVALERPAGPLLGAVPDATFGTASLTVAEDDLLVFYTDGLIERRGRGLDEGLAPIVELLNDITARKFAQPLADLITKLGPASPDDDTCVLAMRVTQPSQLAPVNAATAGTRAALGGDDGR